MALRLSEHFLSGLKYAPKVSPETCSQQTFVKYPVRAFFPPHAFKDSKQALKPQISVLRPVK